MKGILHNYQKTAGGVIWQNSKEGTAGLECLEALHEEKAKKLFCRDLRLAEIAAYLQEMSLSNGPKLSTLTHHI